VGIGTREGIRRKDLREGGRGSRGMGEGRERAGWGRRWEGKEKSFLKVGANSVFNCLSVFV